MAGGTVYPIDVVNDIADHAHALGLKVHMDGARVFNAACYLNRPVSEITAKVDSVMFCLSKGLGAPVGSMVVGTADAIARARVARKRLGGAMRQAGVLAAPALIALEEMPQRLGEDHANARFIAEELARMPGIRLDPRRVQTNIVIFDITGTGLSQAEFVAKVREHGVVVGGTGNPACVRIVTHCNASRADCEQAMERLAHALKAEPSSVGAGR
jgi:threonine aldolase